MPTAEQRGVVTPEAVRLDFEEATVGTRAVAILIDWVIQAVVLTTLTFAATFLLGAIGEVGGATAVIIALLLLTFAVTFGYPIGFEVAWRGRTPGKAAMGLRVVTVEGAPVGFRHAAIRAALGLVDFALTSGFAAVITALVSQRSQRLGDHVAGTVVVRERVAGGSAEAIAFAVPAGAEAYAATIDVSGVGGQDYQTVREFLLRADGLPPERRAALAERLATSLARRLAHQPPPGTHPETFLRCVAAGYQARGHAANGAVGAAASPMPAPAPVARAAPGPGSAPVVPPGAPPTPASPPAAPESPSPAQSPPATQSPRPAHDHAQGDSAEEDTTPAGHRPRGFTAPG
ncbi:MAG: RDD family protein [Egibacteraceae bacterium]